jgi:hypothetical protein
MAEFMQVIYTSARVFWYDQRHCQHVGLGRLAIHLQFEQEECFWR